MQVQRLNGPMAFLGVLVAAAVLISGCSSPAAVPKKVVRSQHVETVLWSNDTATVSITNPFWLTFATFFVNGLPTTCVDLKATGEMTVAGTLLGEFRLEWKAQTPLVERLQAGLEFRRGATGEGKSVQEIEGVSPLVIRVPKADLKAQDVVSVWVVPTTKPVDAVAMKQEVAVKYSVPRQGDGLLTPSTSYCHYTLL